jgi:hypothetical protein
VIRILKNRSLAKIAAGKLSFDLDLGVHVFLTFDLDSHIQTILFRMTLPTVEGIINN